MSQVLLDCKDITRAFGGVLALNQVNVQVYQGEILGLVGPNGSGKTTLINVISGLFRANAGRISFDGADITRKRPSRLARLGLARTYQIPRPFHSVSVIENVALASMFGHISRGKAEALKLAMAHLEFVELAEKAYWPVMQLNLHERKFLEMARALALDPKLLLLDEVLAGLNPSEVKLGVELIKRIHTKGVTLVFVEHNMRAVTALSDRMVVLNYGKDIAEGAPETVMQDSRVIAAYLGQDYAERA